jgi:hypothetical protein
MVDTEGETDPMAIAEKELAQKQVPFIIRHASSPLVLSVIFTSSPLVSSVFLDVFSRTELMKIGELMS